MTSSLGETERLERPHCIASGAAIAGETQRRRNVLLCGEQLPEVVALEDDRDLAAPKLGELALR